MVKIKGGAAKAASNPKYCYNWSFEQPGEAIVVCLWYVGIKPDGTDIVYRLNPKLRGSMRTEPGSGSWNRRAAEMDGYIQRAYTQQLPIRVIVVDGVQRNPKDPKLVASVVEVRLLDPVPWAVKEYDFATGKCLLVRGRVRRFGFTPPATVRKRSMLEGLIKPKPPEDGSSDEPALNSQS